MTSAATHASSARHRAREVALQALFAMNLHRRPEPVGEPVQPAGEETDSRTPPPVAVPSLASAAEIFEGVAENFEMPHAAYDFARHLVLRVIEHRASIDEVLSRHARNWRVSRMAVVDRNILRLATFELIHSDTPAAVILDEAVELARRFGSDTSSSFVNGVLDAVAKQVRHEEAR